MSCKEITLDSA